ncbi:MAG: Gfo/Idh/MocA family oxidoreductase [Candidatus Rokubacteria bacterium]|nr:Gfo/Idh/MocA family oxidoreductase [Candidatus Rokubacteria bacterium]
MTLGWAIVSVGRHADRRMAPAIRQAQDADLVAVYSRDRARAEEFARRHGARVAYDSLDDLLRDSRVDVVYIASPNHLHAPYAEMAATAEKHVLCEKPMALTVEDAVKMVQACRRHGVRLGVAFHLRHHPGHQEARRIVQGGALGTVALATAMWGVGQRGVVFPGPRTGREEWWDHPEMAGAGAMAAYGVHCVDLLRFLLREEVIEVAAVTDAHGSERPLEYLGVMALRFQGGTLGSAFCSRRIPDPRNDCHLYGSQGRLSVLDTLSMTLQGILEVTSRILTTSQTYQPPDDVGMYRRMVEAFERVVQHEEEPDASGVDGLRAVQVMVAYGESARTGRAVRIEPVEA